jgi:hypothetical protein
VWPLDRPSLHGPKSTPWGAVYRPHKGKLTDVGSPNGLPRVTHVGPIGERPVTPTASALCGSTPSVTAILPRSALKTVALLSPCQTSLCGVPGANCRKITNRTLLSDSYSITFADAFDRQGVAKVQQEHRLVGDALNDARLARGHLADDRPEDGRVPVGGGRRLHRHVEVFERNKPWHSPNGPSGSS